MNSEVVFTIKLENGGRCNWNALGQAAFEGNTELIRHIVEVGGKHLLSLGNRFGWTPLFCAANCEDQQNGFMAAEALIKLGANVNLATSLTCDDYRRGKTPEGATPLWAAAERTKNLQLVKLLLQNGAQVSPELLTEKGGAIINTALEEINKEKI